MIPSKQVTEKRPAYDFRVQTAASALRCLPALQFFNCVEGDDGMRVCSARAHLGCNPGRLHDFLRARAMTQRRLRVTADAIRTLRDVRCRDGDELLGLMPRAATTCGPAAERSPGCRTRRSGIPGRQRCRTRRGGRQIGREQRFRIHLSRELRRSQQCVVGTRRKIRRAQESLSHRGTLLHLVSSGYRRLVSIGGASIN
jgi:hypothetical protein